MAPITDEPLLPEEDGEPLPPAGVGEARAA